MDLISFNRPDKFGVVFFSRKRKIYDNKIDSFDIGQERYQNDIRNTILILKSLYEVLRTVHRSDELVFTYVQ